MSLITTDAIVLKTINYKDSSKILTLFSREHGKFTAIGYGSKKIVNSVNAAFQIGNLVRVVVYKKEDIEAMATISQIGITNQFVNIKNNLEKLTLCQYCLEFTYKNIEEGDKNHELYDLLLNSLNNLNNKSPFKDWNTVWNYHGLRVLGFKPNILNCLYCGKQLEKGYWNSEEGGLSCGCNGVVGISLNTSDLICLNKISRKIKDEDNLIITNNIVLVIEDMLRKYTVFPHNSYKLYNKLKEDSL